MDGTLERIHRSYFPVANCNDVTASGVLEGYDSFSSTNTSIGRRQLSGRRESIAPREANVRRTASRGDGGSWPRRKLKGSSAGEGGSSDITVNEASTVTVRAALSHSRDRSARVHVPSTQS